MVAKPPRFHDLEPDAPLERAARTILHSLLTAVLDEAPAVLGGEDARATHDMRVALRRLRTGLATFKRCFPKKALLPYVRATRRVGRRLGDVRDADVHLAALRTALGGATAAEAPGVSFAIEQLGLHRRRALAEFAIELSQYDRDGFFALLARG